MRIPSPDAPPPALTQPTRAYQFRVLTMLLSLVVFLAIYFGMIAGTIWLIQDSFSREDGGFLLGIAGLFFLVFLVKPLFKRQRVNRDEMVEITREKQPNFFAFLDTLIEDIGAPRPKKVFITHTVNAAVFYDSSALSLFLPTQKNLLIGLGLVNSLNVSELKAILAHEFGHFSQKSMKLGSYVYISNQIVSEMIWGRDALDRFLWRISGWDIRIAVFSWAFLAFVWVIRQILSILYRVINLLDAALSRQMEFNADRVAVSTTGSDAIVNGLYKLGFSDACLDQALIELFKAKDHKLYTDDLFYHQTEAIGHLRNLADEPLLGEPPPLPDTAPGDARIFEIDDDSRPSMWATHPPSSAREQNAKALYVPCEINPTPAWALFDKPDELRKAVTAHFLSQAIEGAFTTSPAQKVQAFIDTEREETTYARHYKGLYDERTIDFDELESSIQETQEQELTSDNLAERYAALFKEKCSNATKALHDSLSDLSTFANFMESGQRHISIRGTKHSQASAADRIATLSEQALQSRSEISAIQRDVVRVHLRMAEALDSQHFGSLCYRYTFQKAIQTLRSQLGEEASTLENVLQVITQEEIEANDWHMAKLGLEKMIETFAEVREQSKSWTLPPMSSFEEDQNLSDFVFEGYDAEVTNDLRESILVDDIQEAFLRALIAAYDQAEGRFDRLIAKCTGGTLNLQDEIASQWHQEAALPNPAIADSE